MSKVFKKVKKSIKKQWSNLKKAVKKIGKALKPILPIIAVALMFIPGIGQAVGGWMLGSTAASTVVAGTTLGSIVGNAVIMGAASGAVSYSEGGSFGKGFLKGAAGSAAGTVVGGMVGEATAGWGTGMAAGAARGAISGAITGGMTGGKEGMKRGALTGAAMGAFTSTSTGKELLSTSRSSSDPYAGAPKDNIISRTADRVEGWFGGGEEAAVSTGTTTNTSNLLSNNTGGVTGEASVANVTPEQSSMVGKAALDTAINTTTSPTASMEKVANASGMNTEQFGKYVAASNNRVEIETARAVKNGYELTGKEIQTILTQTRQDAIDGRITDADMGNWTVVETDTRWNLPPTQETITKSGSLKVGEVELRDVSKDNYKYSVSNLGDVDNAFGRQVGVPLSNTEVLEQGMGPVKPEALRRDEIGPTKDGTTVKLEGGEDSSGWDWKKLAGAAGALGQSLLAANKGAGEGSGGSTRPGFAEVDIGASSGGASGQASTPDLGSRWSNVQAHGANEYLAALLSSIRVTA
jgi:hypothetical protein